MDRPRSPPALPPTRNHSAHRSSSPPPQYHPSSSAHHYSQTTPDLHYPDHPHSRPDSGLSDSRLLPFPPPARHSISSSSASVTNEVTPPASPPHKRFKLENPLPPPFPCHVDQRWHYSHGPYPPSFYPYPYHHQNMPHRVEDMTVDRPISHRSDGPAQYQFMPSHSHPTPPPIATLHHSPALSASSLESNSISPSPPITQPSTPYYSHPTQAPTMSQAQYPYQPNGSMARYGDESSNGYGVPPHASQSLSTRSIRPTIVSAQPYPGQANYIIHTDDASTKLSDRVRRKCYNCRTTDTSTWRRSSLTPGKVLCNKCGLFERTHSRPRPEQFPHKRGPVVNVNQFKQHRNTPPPSHVAQAAAQAALAQQAQSQQVQPQRLPSMSTHMLAPHHYSHPSLSPLMAARSSDAQQQYRTTEIGALLNGPGEAGASTSAGSSPQQGHQQPQQHAEQVQQQQSPHGIKRSGSPLEQPQHPSQSDGQQQAQGSPQVAAGSIPNSPRNERREAPTGSYRASN